MLYPALEVHGVDSELLEAMVDDHQPTAIEPRDTATLVYFTDASARDRAHAVIVAAWPDATIARREIDDEDWARRSQENLAPVTVGRLTVTPPWHAATVAADAIAVVISPSMGFGTGHHATTRLCLAALQTLPVMGAHVLDVGTGSGVLAIAGRLLGAASAVGVDYDADAIQAANENLEANRAADRVTFFIGDLRHAPPEPADIVTANLMGALLIQTASLLLSLVRSGGTLIVSGLLEAERDAVVAAFSPESTLVWEQQEEGWVALAFTPMPQS